MTGKAKHNEIKNPPFIRVKMTLLVSAKTNVSRKLGDISTFVIEYPKKPRIRYEMMQDDTPNRTTLSIFLSEEDFSPL
jgi:hypothetical protein